MQPNLSSELLRTFVAIVEEQGFIRAAERLHKTQSTISQQVRRLEQELGVSLFRADGRKRALTLEGEVMLGYARRLLAMQEEAFAAVSRQQVPTELRIGVSSSLSDGLLPDLLARFNRRYPAVRLSVQTAFSEDLDTEFEAERYDLVLKLGQAGGTGGGELIGTDPLIWIGAPGYQWSREAPLPLVLIEERCLFRKAAQVALDAEGIAWRVTYQTRSFSSLMAAVSAGLGVSIRTRGSVNGGVEAVGSDLGLPVLPALNIELRYRKGDGQVEDLAEMIRSHPLLPG